MSRNFISVDVGGTKVLATAVTEDGKFLGRHKEKTDRRSSKRLVEQINNCITSAITAAKLTDADIAGVALGVPGVVETATGYVVFTPNAPLSETPLGALMGERFRVPVIVGNDADFGVVGEHWLGAGRGSHSSFGIFVGTGIGGGLVLDNKLIQGHRGLGGEIGHLMIPLGADEISGMLTRKHSFLEDMCSRTAIENQLRHAILKEGKTSVLPSIVGDRKLERIRSKALREALKRKDKLVTDVMRRSSYLLGLATASVLHVVDPEVIIFGGGVIEACGDFMLPLIEKTAHKVAMPGTGKPLQIVRSQLGDDAIVLGGVAMLRQQFAPETSGAMPAVATKASVSPNRPLAQVDKPLAAEG